MNPVKRAKVEIVMTDLILKQAMLRDIRLQEYRDVPEGARDPEDERAMALLNKVERELAVVIKDLVELCGAELAGDEKQAARVLAASGHTQFERDFEQAMDLAWDFEASAEVRNAARGFLGLDPL